MLNLDLKRIFKLITNNLYLKDKIVNEERRYFKRDYIRVKKSK